MDTWVASIGRFFCERIFFTFFFKLLENEYNKIKFVKQYKTLHSYINPLLESSVCCHRVITEDLTSYNSFIP